MRIPLSWLREIVDIPADINAQQIADILTGIGFEEEEVQSFGAGLSGPVVVGQILEFVEEPQANGKTIRWCQVQVGPSQINGIVCGANNFFVGDKVVVALPGAVLPGDFAITPRKTYGHVSDGMICSARELQFSDDHDGIIRLSTLGLDPEIGSDAVALLGLIDDVIDASVLPDRGYAMSMRGIARELHIATGWPWRDPAAIDGSIVASPHAVVGAIEDPTAATRLVLRTITGLDRTASSPIWMQRRLYMAGMRAISLAVDVTNYVMIELGQPLHAFDADKVTGSLRVRRTGAKTSFVTLDGVERQLEAHDIVIADDSGPVALAGTKGGMSTEIDDSSTNVVLEAANFSAGDVSRTSRSLGLSSDASRRFERGVDTALQPFASARAVALLREFGGATEVGAIDVDLRPPATVISMSPDFPAAYIGSDFTHAEVRSSLLAIGCDITEGDVWQVTVPSWRSDLSHAADLVEEVARLCGYDRIPSVLPIAPPGLGLTVRQRLRRDVSRQAADAGLVEVLSYPFVGEVDFDLLGLAALDQRRSAVRLANPLSAEQPFMRTTMLAPLLSAAKRNIGRGHNNVAIFEVGEVVSGAEDAPKAPVLATHRRPSESELAQLDAAVPNQPLHLAAVMTGAVERGDAVLAPGAAWDWQSSIATAVALVAVSGAEATVSAADRTPWHPGRCAALAVDGTVIGYAGELHPRVVERYGLPARTCAFEVDLTALDTAAARVVVAQPVKVFPKATLDVALMVPSQVAAEDVRAAIVAAAGELLESARLFDVYEGAQVAEGHKSLAFALEFRAPDRTLTDAEVLASRDLIVAACADRLGAVLR